MIKFSLSLEVFFEEKDSTNITFEEVEDFFNKKVNEMIKKEKAELKDVRVISSMEAYK